MNGKRYQIGLMVIIMLSFISISSAIEEPKYKVIKEYEEIEIREYSSYIVAETEVDTSFEDAGNIAHGILFDYISGNNYSREEMEMTIPVNQQNPEESGEEMEMTVPVVQNAKLNSSGKFAVSFVLPLKYTLQTAPQPKDERITIREIPKKLMAVIEYSGTWSEENYREHEEELMNELLKEGYEITGDPIWARYDPPFMPWFLRRNEVMVQVNPQN